MSLLKKIFVLFLIMIALILIPLGALSLSANYNYCVGHNGEHASEQKNKTVSPIIQAAIDNPTPIKLLQYCGGNYVAENADAMTGIATVLLTIATLLLGWLAYDQGRTTRAQLRAYVFMTAGDIDEIDTPTGKAIRATLQIENAGQTPAYKVRADAYWRHECGGDVKNFNKQTLGDQQFTLAPHAQVPTIAFVKASVIPKPAEGTEPKFFVVGRIDYVDVFKRRQWTNIRCEVRRDGSSGQLNMHPSPNGNDAS